MNGSRRSIGRVTALIAGVGLCCVLAGTTVADGVLPVTLKLKETEAGRFLAQWRVPKQLPPSAIPSPALPESCRVVGGKEVTERPGAWIVRQVYRCPDGLSGQQIGVDYPFLNATVSTLLRVELLSGDRYAHMLSPGEERWQVPRSTAGEARRWSLDARQAVQSGAVHFVGNGLHITFAMVLVLLGGWSVSFRLATGFAAGQLVAVALSSATGIQLGAPLAEIGVATAVVLLAREALRPPAERRQLLALAVAAGLVHGLGLTYAVPRPADYSSPSLLFYGLVVLGMDAALLLSVMAGSGLWRLVSRRVSRRGFATAAIYAVGVAAVALTLGMPPPDATDARGARPSGLRIPDLPIPDGADATPASRRVATPFPDAPLQSFVSIAPFELRHEILVRLRAFAERVGLDRDGEVPIASQESLKRRILDLVSTRATVSVDGLAVEAMVRRVDFLGLDSRGALPRQVPVPEPVESAWIGVTMEYMTERTPTEAVVTWTGFDTELSIPATVTDPESSQSVELTRSQPSLWWINELSEDPTPVVTEIAVEPPVLWTPIVSLILSGVVIVFAVVAFRRRRTEFSATIVRVGLASALLLAPFGNIALPLPAFVGTTPDPNGARRILARVLPNVYRAFEYPTESSVYDRLALSVTGDTLTEIYLEHRRAVRMEERGGAKAAVEAVEVAGVESVDAAEAGGFVARTAWTVGGTVTHFGHRHFRQNRYDARVAVVPVDGYWKIRSVEVFDEKRLR